MYGVPKIYEPEVRDYFKTFSSLVSKEENLPYTKEVSDFVRQVTDNITRDMEPDQRFLMNTRAEFVLFEIMEYDFHIAPVNELCDTLVDKERFDALQTKFLSMSQSRKSRAGYSTENHVMYELELFGLEFSFRQKCDGGIPDILLPGTAYYGNLKFPAEYLMVLEVKRTTKERYQQVLTKMVAKRAQHRSLLLLEEHPYPKMLEDLARAKHNIVVPQPLQANYPKVKGLKMYTLQQYMEVAKVYQELSSAKMAASQ